MTTPGYYPPPPPPPPPPFEFEPSHKIRNTIIGLTVASLVAGGGYFGYNYWKDSQPTPVVFNQSATGASAERAYLSCLKEYNPDCLKGILPKSYTALEAAYANNNEVRLEFIKAVTSTIEMSLPQVQNINQDGTPAFTKEGQPIMMESTLNFGEPATFTYFDYKEVEFRKNDIARLIVKENLTSDDVEYQRKLTDIFAQYMTNYIQGKYSTPPKMTQTTRSPGLACEGEGAGSSCQMSLDEDIFWDQTLFSSDPFMDLQDRFANYVARLLGVAPLKSELSSPLEPTPPEGAPVPPPPGEVPPPPPGDVPPPPPEGAPVPPPPGEVPPPPPEPVDPLASLAAIPGIDEPLDKDDSSKSRSRKYPDAFYLEDNWLGAYNLMSDVAPDGTTKAANLPKQGNGTFESPAGLGTPVVTFQYDEQGNKLPIRIVLTKFLTGQEALTEMEAKSHLNRGFTLDSEVKYAYFEFEYTNLSNVPVGAHRNDSLSDAQGNLSDRTGTVFGLQTHHNMTMPDQTVTLQSWTSSTHLNDLYLIWGANFKQADPKVWFKVLRANDPVAAEVPETAVEPSSSEELVPPTSFTITDDEPTPLEETKE